jgi:hypothetical protein
MLDIDYHMTLMPYHSHHSVQKQVRCRMLFYRNNDIATTNNNSGGGRGGGCPRGFEGNALNTTHDFLDRIYEISLD